MPLLGEIPGLDKAVEREAFDRLAAFVGANEIVAGVRVKMLTTRMELELDAAKSPFLRGKVPSAGDCALFLWRVSTEYDAPCPWWTTQRRWDERRKKRFVNRIARLDYVETAIAIFDYIAEANADGPGGGDDTGTPSASWVSGVIDIVASAYGWSEDLILDLPKKRFWQYWRLIMVRKTMGEIKFVNNADKVRAKYMRELNEAKKAEREKSKGAT